MPAPRTHAVLIAALIALPLLACSRKKGPAPSESWPSVAVQTVVVDRKTTVSTEEVVGTVRAKLAAAIEPKVSARIESLLVAPGQMVKAGELIAQLDAREIQAKLDQALALREQAVRDLARARDLMEKKITAQSEFDAVNARERVSAGTLKEAETNLAYTKIVAPFEGVVTRKLADVGDLATPGKPIIEMEDPRALRFEADVPESLLGRLHLGMKVPIHISANALEGTVVEMAPIADPGSRTFLVRLDLPAAENLRSGQFGRALVVIGEAATIRVPTAAVVVRGQMETVFVVVNQHAQLRLVRSGRSADGFIELLSGISEGDRVIVKGVEQLHDGQPVTPQS